MLGEERGCCKSTSTTMSGDVYTSRWTRTLF
jgi:hypothetical protein